MSLLPGMLTALTGDGRPAAAGGFRRIDLSDELLEEIVATLLKFEAAFGRAR